MNYNRAPGRKGEPCLDLETGRPAGQIEYRAAGPGRTLYIYVF
jgi:hypothetical protein